MKLDFFLLGYLKFKTDTNRPGIIGDLKVRIRHGLENITAAMLTNVRDEFNIRIGHCLTANP